MRFYQKLAFSLTALAIHNQSIAAQYLDMKDHKNDLLQSFVMQPQLRSQPAASLNEISRYTDPSRKTHIRMQEYYRGYPVWGAQVVVHIPEAAAATKSLSALLVKPDSQQSMNGKLYQKLDADLEKLSNVVFNPQQSELAAKSVIDAYKEKNDGNRRIVIGKPTSRLIVFVNQKTQEARWAYQVSFNVPPATEGALPAKPVYIVDALTFKIYKNWDDIKTASTNNEFAVGGGFGGNPTIGKLIYDGLQNHLASFKISREGSSCLLKNNEIVVADAQSKQVMQYPCEKSDAEHNNVFWAGAFDAANGGYSPANDAMFAAQVIKQLYRDWYGVPALINDDGSEMVLQMNVHVKKMDNAYWDGVAMTFGDGSQLYPLTSLGVAAHEVSHGFTQQHSNLNYDGQSGGMNESFSDMAAQTAEYYGYGKSSWSIGSEIFKLQGEALRFMDKPSKDCYGKEPGTFCSIDRADQFYDGLNVHFSSGVYNRAFYLLSTTPGWDPRKAFAVMLHANASYWLSETQYADGAACAVKAAEDLQYDKHAVEEAFKAVGIEIPSSCTNSGH